MNIGERIRELREKAELTQIELAQNLKIRNSTLSMYEKGKILPSDDIKIAIADYFGVSIDYLLGRTDQREKKPTPGDGDGLSPLDQRLNDLLAKESDETKLAMIDFLERFRKP